MPSAPHTSSNRARRPIVVWLACVCALIVTMVVIGGITRLTGSGLSIVNWDPIVGAVPPLNEQAWHVVFAKYQQSPQYRLVNSGMTLERFKGIFFWEYLHRLVARLIGVIFFVPALIFFLRGKLDRPLAVRLAIGFVLGGLQGALGWFMVKSGLVDAPHVSHYRLAAHLLLALLVLAYLFWLLLDLTSTAKPTAERSESLKRLATVLVPVVLLQIAYGAFTAGLKAGYGYSTFPKMNGQWIPAGLSELTPAWLNLFDNPTAIQFIHRSIAWLLLFSITGFWLSSRHQPLSRRQRLSINIMAALVAVQFALGVTTLLLVVPVSVATLHQLGACLLFLATLWVNHSLRREAAPASAGA